MITIKKLRWSNAFSYGKDNEIDFSVSPLTQLVGRNGHGKSSIALILEEVLFNKNSKGIKKADILNRYTKDKSYSIELEFSRDGTEYLIKSNRGSTQTVKLYKNGQDVSAHTATATYKVIEDAIGIDHKAFSQIVYQSNASSLEFLTAPDTARKKFLIEILNLTKYTKAQEVFKEVSAELSKDITSVQSQVNTVKAWLDKYENTDLSLMPSVEVEQVPETAVARAAELAKQLQDIDAINKKIAQNNTYKKLQSQISILPIPDKPVEDPTIKTQIDAATKRQVLAKKTSDDAVQFAKKVEGLCGKCPTCMQTIDTEKISAIVEEQNNIKQEATKEYTEAANLLAELKAKQVEFTTQKTLWQNAVKAQEDWEKYHQLIDTTLPSESFVETDLQQELDNLNDSIKATKALIAKAEKHNTAAAAHNSKIELISKQLVEMNQELEQYSEALHLLSERMSILNVLTKTFSTTGLVAYKIECLVKDLEELTNRYLIDLSDGRFQISFKINASDKLNVVITDNGNDIEMLALSGGEKARVNVATLLAIRKLMQTLSSSRINLLILDETVEALDVDGKEKLVEVLLQEEHLNTFLVSHGFTHPLLEKINVIKKNNISQIEA